MNEEEQTEGAYIALYRKWRPQTFADMVGQAHVSRTLTKAIETKKISHAYLFAGPRGTGKTSAAKIFAKALNCENGPTPSPCGKCDACRHITDGTSMDVFEIDAASNRGIDEIRDLRETVKFAPTEGKYKVYIIDEVHMLTVEAFNALLKTLEEPPPHVVFIMATTEAHKIPVTIKSRTQRYDFKRITNGDIVQRLRFVADNNKPPVPVDDEAIETIARVADGGMRDALSLLDQAWSLEGSGEVIHAETVQNILGIAGQEQIYDIAAAIAEKNAERTLALLGELLANGKDLKQLLTNIIKHFRNLMLFKAVGNVEGIDWFGTPENILREQAAKFSHEGIVRRIARLNETAKELTRSTMPRITAEVALIALCEEDSFAPANAAQPAAVQPLASSETASLARLEAKVAALSAQLAALAKKGAVVTTEADKSTAANTLPPVREKANAAPKKNIAVSDRQLGQIWQKFMQVFERKNKKVILYCMQQGRLVSLNENQFVVEFKSDYYVSTAEKHREFVEATFSEVVGGSPHLCAVLEGSEIPAAKFAAPRIKSTKKAAPPVLPQEPPADEGAAAVEDMDEAAKRNLQNAIDVFGGDVVEVT